MTTITLAALIATVIADGIVDDAEVQQIRDVIMDDGVVDTDEVRALFEINDAVSGNTENSASWEPTFVELVANNILADGKIDADEEALLTELIMGDGVIDSTEAALLIYLDEEAGLPESLKGLLSQAA